MVLAHPADTETDLAIRIDHETSLTGWCRYASIAQFERTSLCRSPHLTLLMISSSKKLADQFGSPSSPVLSRTLQAISKDCSISSLSVIPENGSAIAVFLSEQTMTSILLEYEGTNWDDEKPDTQCRADRKYTSRIDNEESRTASAPTVCAQSNRGTKMVGQAHLGWLVNQRPSFRIDVTWRCACRTS